MTFARHVGRDTILRARFNWWEPSLGYKKGNHPGLVYLSRIREADMNLVVVEISRYEDEKTRTDLYFGTFQGKPSRECNTPDERRKFNWEIARIATRSHRIAGRDLEVAINKVVDEALEIKETKYNHITSP